MPRKRVTGARKQRTTPPTGLRAGGETNSVRAANLSLVPRAQEKVELVAPEDFGEFSRAVPRSRNCLIGGENRGLCLCGYRDHLHRRHGQLRSERIDLAEVPAA